MPCLTHEKKAAHRAAFFCYRLSANQAAREARAEIDKNYELARAVNATGTPTFVVGDQVLQGAVGYDALKQAIAEARAAE